MVVVVVDLLWVFGWNLFGFFFFFLSCVLGVGGCSGCWLVATSCGGGCWSLGGGHCHCLCLVYWQSFVLQIYYFNICIYYFNV